MEFMNDMKKASITQKITAGLLAFMSLCTLLYTVAVLLRMSVDSVFNDFLYCCTIGISYFGMLLLAIGDYSIGEFNLACALGILVILCVIVVSIVLIINLIRKQSKITSAIIILFSCIGLLLSFGILLNNLLLGLFYIILRVLLIVFCIKNIKFIN